MLQAKAVVGLLAMVFQRESCRAAASSAGQPQSWIIPNLWYRLLPRSLYGCHASTGVSAISSPRRPQGTPVDQHGMVHLSTKARVVSHLTAGQGGRAVKAAVPVEDMLFRPVSVARDLQPRWATILRLVAHQPTLFLCDSKFKLQDPLEVQFPCFPVGVL